MVQKSAVNFTDSGTGVDEYRHDWQTARVIRSKLLHSSGYMPTDRLLQLYCQYFTTFDIKMRAGQRTAILHISRTIDWAHKWCEYINWVSFNFGGPDLVIKPFTTLHTFTAVRIQSRTHVCMNDYSGEGNLRGLIWPKMLAFNWLPTRSERHSLPAIIENLYHEMSYTRYSKLRESLSDCDLCITVQMDIMKCCVIHSDDMASQW
jgi:hypothetical protein